MVARVIGGVRSPWDELPMGDDVSVDEDRLRANPGKQAARLVPQSAPGSAYPFGGEALVDGTIFGTAWSSLALTYSFPDDGSAYGDGYGAKIGAPYDVDPASLIAFTQEQQRAVRYALGLVASYTPLTFREVAETTARHADLRLGTTADPHIEPPFANLPADSSVSGDIWFPSGTWSSVTRADAKGGDDLLTLMHEVGHALGLKHGQDDRTGIDLGRFVDGAPTSTFFAAAELPADRRGYDWSVMVYQSHPGEFSIVRLETDKPQTYMQSDIAALQAIYGANYATNAGDTVYAWDPVGGEFLVDGIGQGAPKNGKILMTVWDGNGIDRYDLSAFDDNLEIDLAPGAASVLAVDKLVTHSDHPYAAATGNVFNALLHGGDARSLVEDAIGGRGNDRLVGNQVANRLAGGAGADLLVGLQGNDVLVGGDGDDRLFGDGKSVTSAGVGSGPGTLAVAHDAGNDTRGDALDLGDRFAPDRARGEAGLRVDAVGSGKAAWYRVDLDADARLDLNIPDRTTNYALKARVFDAAGALLTKAEGRFVGPDDAVPGDPLHPLIYEGLALGFTARVTGPYWIEVAIDDWRDPATSVETERAVPLGDRYTLILVAHDVPAVGGGSGNDTLSGGPGHDTLAGGPGRDTFRDGAEGLDGDTIADLEPVDVIHITDGVADRFSFAFDAASGALTYSVDGGRTAGHLTIEGGFAGGFAAVADADGGIDLVPTAGSNAPPSTGKDAVTAREGTALPIPVSDLLANDRDPEGGMLRVTGIGNASQGHVAYDPSTGTVTFTPNPGFRGPAGFTYTVVDDEGVANQGTVAVSVVPAGTASAYRFVERTTAEHFYTTSTAERDGIIRTLPNYAYQGAAWATPETSDLTQDVFRFYDTATKTHFYTASAAERDGILGTLASYTYEGVAFQAYKDGVGVPGGLTLERFYNTATGQHHFAAPDEADGIRQGMIGPDWVDEGPGLRVGLPAGDLLV